MIKRLPSTNVELYPSAYRETFNKESHLNTEFNITTLMNRLTKDSFVFKYLKDGVDHIIYFSLHGYYFRVRITPTILSYFTNNVYGKIRIKPKVAPEQIPQVGYPDYTLVGYNNDGTVELTTLDEEVGSANVFTGMVLTDDITGLPDTDYAIKLLVKSGSDWVVPNESKIKFNLKDLFGEANIGTATTTTLEPIIYKDEQLVKGFFKITVEDTTLPN